MSVPFPQIKWFSVTVPAFASNFNTFSWVCVLLGR